MIFKIVLITFLLSACVTKNANSSSSLAYENIRNFVVGSTTQADVLATLGSPTNAAAEGEHLLVSYDDPKTGAQRLSLSFSSKTDKLSSVLWIPKESEKEYSLKQAQEGFKNASFKEVVNERKNPHALSLATVSYIDSKSGVTIRYNQNQKAVEAIAIYDGSVRIPAGQNKTDQIPYTLGQ